MNRMKSRILLFRANFCNLSLILVLSCLLLAGLSVSSSAQEGAQWIWSSDKDKAGAHEIVHFRKSFTLNGKIRNARLFATCDNEMIIWVDGKKVAESKEWASPVKMDISKFLTSGKNHILAVQGKNDSGNVAGLLVDLTIEPEKGKNVIIRSGSDWKFSKSPGNGWQKPGYDDSNWSRVVLSGSFGISPWGKVGSGGGGNSKQPAGQGTDPAQLIITKGFKIDKIYDVPKSSEGSWVALTTGPAGTLIASDQGGQGIYQIALNNGAVKSVSKLPISVSGAQGLLWDNGSLYVHVNGKGFYKATDSNNDGLVDNVLQLNGPNGGGEHGNHAVILSEDNQDLYVVAGNHTHVPDFIKKARIDMNWQEDLLLPRQWDARGHARGRLAPGGWIAKVSKDAKDWDIYSIGYRNQYDVAINRHGDMFSYDADMEWDMGSPWYRPTRICHVTSGSEFGWRSGTGKWPVYFEDSLPPTIDIGPGCPTGTVFGTGAKFPAKYQDALYALDWTFGTVYAIHLTPDGASYSASSEEFISGSPFPVTDAVVGDDGALYIAIGGRGTQSALYRVTYTGGESTAPATSPLPPEASLARSKRLQLEQWHRADAPPAIKFIWPELGSDDRFIRYAARVALEFQPVDSYAEKAFNESDPQTKLSAIIAWARKGSPNDLPKALGSLLELPVSKLNKQQTLGLLRAYSLCFIRQGKPSDDLRQSIISHINGINLQSDRDLQTEWVKLNVYLDSPDVVTRALSFIGDSQKQVVPEWEKVVARNAGYGGTISKMLSNMPPSDKIEIALQLRNVQYGWTLDQRKQYFDFLAKAATHTGGASYKGFLDNIRKEALALCSESEKEALAKLNSGQAPQIQVFKSTPPKGPGRAWTVSAAASAVSGGGSKPDFESGRNLYHATACSACHLFAGEGGAIGPDLSSVRNKFSLNDLLESIIEPSKVISDQYGSVILTTTDGETHQGRVLLKDTGKKAAHYNVYSSDPAQEPVAISASKVKSVEPSKVSQMPPGLINSLNPSELRDLIAYLMSRGNPNDPVYK